MMLFDMPKQKDPEPVKTDGAVITGEAQQLSPSNYVLQDLLALIRDNTCVHWVSDGDWSTHELLHSILQLAGPADVYLSSYAFSEYPARLIADLKERKVIKNLYCIIDSRLDVRSASALTIIRNVATRCELLNTHAKVTVIENDEYSIAIVGSANYTTNKRYESGIVVTEKKIVDFHKQWLIKAMDKIRSK